jgi:hypothetical protein
MLGLATEDHDPLAARRRSRRVIAAFVVVGCVAFIAGLELGYPLVGVGVYWACGIGFMGYSALTDAEPVDERDEDVMANAAGVTMTVAAVVLIAGAPGMSALEAADVSTAPAWFWGAMFAIAGMFGVFAIANAYYQRRI